MSASSWGLSGDRAGQSGALWLDGGVQGSLENSDRGKEDFCFVLLFSFSEYFSLFFDNSTHVDNIS